MDFNGNAVSMFPQASNDYVPCKKKQSKTSIKYEEKRNSNKWNTQLQENIEYSIENAIRIQRKVSSNLTVVSFFDEEPKVESYQAIINNQKGLIYELRKQNKNLTEKHQKLNYINKLTKDEELKKKENAISFYEDKINQLERSIEDKERIFSNYEEKTLKDFLYKEKKILEQHDIIAQLGDEKMKLIHIINENKDKNKKKLYEVESKVKFLTTEMQKVIRYFYQLIFSS